MAVMDWSADGWRSAFRIELRVQAIDFASRGWPVLPGTYPASTGWVGRGNTDTRGPIPIHRDWQLRLDTGADQIGAWWAEQPYSLLAATGEAVEAIEVDADMGRSGAKALRQLGVPAPIAATPDGRWYFLTNGGQRLCDQLAEHPDVRLHTTGSWVPLPPSTFPNGVMHWRVKPHVYGWRLPEPELVQRALCTGSHEHENVADLVTATR